MNVIHVQGNGPLTGEITVQGSKNAVLPILAATILIDGTCILKNCPDISDVHCMLQLLKSMGCTVLWEEEGLKVDASSIKESRLPRETVISMRSSVILLGPLLARCKEASMSYPGGCVIGERPIDIHLYILEQLGAVFSLEQTGIKGKASKLLGKEITLRFPSVGATENGILASVLAKGRTILRNCAKEPEIQELCFFLNKAGADIKGIGTSTLIIDGVNSLYPLTYTVEADRIVAGTYLLSAVATQGDICIRNAPVSVMESTIETARKMGCKIWENEQGLRVRQSDRPSAIPYIDTSIYPGFPTDLQSVLITVLAKSKGESIVEETIFSNRFRIAEDLKRMGAAITIKGKCAHICGVDNLIGRHVVAEDLRGGAALVLAGICADGETFINNCHYICRGYENICRDFRLLGASIESIS